MNRARKVVKLWMSSSVRLTVVSEMWVAIWLGVVLLTVGATGLSPTMGLAIVLFGLLVNNSKEGRQPPMVAVRVEASLCLSRPSWSSGWQKKTMLLRP